MDIEINNIITPVENDLLFNHFQNKKNIQGLIQLYQSSQIECSRSSGLTPEVGSSRERDLIASFVNNSDLDVVYNISNDKEEDVIIHGNKISIKHSSNKNKSQSGIKIIWTVDIEKRNEFIKNFQFTCDIIIVYVRFSSSHDKGELEIIYLHKKNLHYKHEEFTNNNKNVFKLLEGNSRGIEFDKKFFEEIIKLATFHIHIHFVIKNCTLCDPIQNRIKLLQVLP